MNARWRAVLIAIGVLLVRCKSRLDRLGKPGNSWQRLLPLVSAVVTLLDVRNGCGKHAPRIRRPRAGVCAGHPATMPPAAVRRSAAGIEAG
jgi:hypothetical protein